MKQNYFVELEKRAKLAEESYSRLKKECNQFRQEKELFPPITTDPLFSLLVDNFGRKIYELRGRISVPVTDGILFQENVYFKNY